MDGWMGSGAGVCGGAGRVRGVIELMKVMHQTTFAKAQSAGYPLSVSIEVHQLARTIVRTSAHPHHT